MDGSPSELLEYKLAGPCCVRGVMLLASKVLCCAKSGILRQRYYAVPKVVCCAGDVILRRRCYTAPEVLCCVIGIRLCYR